MMSRDDTPSSVRPRREHASLRPEGAQACSHGCSPRLAGATRGNNHAHEPRPGGVEELDSHNRKGPALLRPGTLCRAVIGRGGWMFLRPSRAGESFDHRFHGLRCAREDAGCAVPVATGRRPFGAKRRGLCLHPPAPPLCLCVSVVSISPSANLVSPLRKRAAHRLTPLRVSPHPLRSLRDISPASCS